jgi:hypothetical protein
MDEGTSIKEYPFPWPDQDKGYNLFPDELEDDELIAFHGTAEANRQSIVNEGFKFGGTLNSVSFAKQSALALKYGSEARTQASPRGCVVVVRFAEPILRPGIKVETSTIHVYSLDEKPEVIGYCVIPEDYVFR